MKIKDIDKENLSFEEIQALDQEYYLNCFGTRLPAVFEYGEGSTLYDREGKAYLDFLAGIAVNILGYGHPAILNAIETQSKKLLHCSNFFYIKSQSFLAKALVENSCGDKAFFCNSGAEANEGAIKLARKYFYAKGKHKYEIITTLNSFHGRTMATLSATGQEKYQKPFEPMPTGFVHVPYNDINAIKKAINYSTCAVMVEPIQGEGGIVEANLDYMKELKELCDKKDILLIFDEVQTGIGRTGKLFGYQHYDIEPDIFTLAKGLGGGIPIGAVVAKDEIASAIEPGDHGTTFGGNPLATSVGLAVLSTIIEDEFLEKVEEKAAFFKGRLLDLKNSYSFIKDIRGKGLMLGLELNSSIEGKDVVLDMLNRGFIINCTGDNTLRFVPPLIIEKQEIERFINGLDQSFSSFGYKGKFNDLGKEK